jgi:antitoxin CptB
MSAMMQTVCSEKGMELRRLRYRLQRLGMLELEAWLARLEPALCKGDEPVIHAAQQLLDMQTPQLLAMMHAETPLPEVLQPWLGIKPL